MQGSRVLGVGINSFRNTPTNNSGEFTYSVHAEVAAIDPTHLNTPNTKLYVVRAKRNNHSIMMPSKPCWSCLRYIETYTRIKEVVFS